MGAFERILNRGDGPRKGANQSQGQQAAPAPDESQEQQPVPNSPVSQAKADKGPDKLQTPVEGQGIPYSPSSQMQQDKGPKHLESPAPVTMAQIYEKLNGANKPLTDEQLEAQSKKERRDKMFAAIGDGISALSNLFFTTQYAPNMYDGRNSMSERMRARYDKLNKEREAREKEYSAGMYNAIKYDAEMALQKERSRREAAKAERDAQLFKLQLDLQNKKISAADAEAQRKQIEADFAKELGAAKVQTEKSRGKAHEAAASASRARANYYNNGGSNGGKKNPSLTISGEKIPFDTNEDYERAVMRYAKEYGIDTMEDSEETTEETTSGGVRPIEQKKSSKKSSKRRRNISEIAADVERASEQRNGKKKNPMGGSEKKKNPMSL